MPSMRTCARVSLKGVKEVQKCQSRKNLLTREASYTSCNMRGHRAPRRMGPFCNTASFSQSCARSHIHLGIGHVPFVLFQ